MAGIIVRDDFQGLCLENVSGSETMDCYDIMPQQVRKRLQHSPFNICPACVAELTPRGEDYVRRCIETITAMEDNVRRGLIN